MINLELSDRIYTTDEIMICDQCQGEGTISEHIMIDYHKSIYKTENHTCKKCKGKGRYRIKTSISYEHI